MSETTGHWGLDFVRAIQERRPGLNPPPWIVKTDTLAHLTLSSFAEGRSTHLWRAHDAFSMQDGFVQGGFALAIADASQSVCIITTHRTFEIWVTVDFHIRYVRPIRVGTLVRVESVLVEKTRTRAVVESTLAIEEDGKLAARVSGAWTKLERMRDLPQ